MKPEIRERRRKKTEHLIATWDGTIGAFHFPDGRQVPVVAEEHKPGSAWIVTLSERDLSSGEPAVVDGGDYMQANDGDFEVNLAWLIARYSPTQSN